MGGTSSKTTNEKHTFEKIQQDPLQAIKLKQEEEKLKHLQAAAKQADAEAKQADAEAKQADAEAKQADAAAKTKIIDVETEAKVKEIKVQSAERIKQFALETKAKDLENIAKGISNQKLGAEAIEQVSNVRLKYVRYGIPIFAGLLLAMDYIYHDYEPFICWRMKNTILDFRRNQKMQRIPPVYCPPPPSQKPLVPKTIPTLLLGPSGSGKSTILANILREYIEKMQSSNATPPSFSSSLLSLLGFATPSPLKTPAPVVLISLRDARTQNDKKEGDKKQKTEESALFRMNKIAAQVFDQIGFPSRKPLISNVKFLPHVFGFLSDAKAQYELEVQAKYRFTFALKCLVDVCVDIRNDRFKSGKYTENEAAVILLLDEIHDLVKETKLKSIGGEDIIGYLAELLVSYGVNAPYIRSVIAESSGNVRTDVEKTAIMKRYSVYYLNDPETATLKAKLREKGYSEEDCNKMVNVCGTRLRLFQAPLEEQVNVDTFIVGLQDSMKGTYKDLYEQIPSLTDRKRMTKVFDSLYNNEIVDWSTDVPTAETTLDSDYFTKLLYVDTKKEVYFQSQVARDVWPIVRTQKLVAHHELLNGTKGEF